MWRKINDSDCTETSGNPFKAAHTRFARQVSGYGFGYIMINKKNMTEKDKKQFGIWMDSHHAVVAGKASAEEKNFSILAHVDNAGAEFNTSEKNAHNDEKTLQHKYFKEILRHMQNAEEVHLTGTGTSQEQLMHFMKETPQFKHTITTESTANKMSDENLVEYIAAHFDKVHTAG
jgi:stalled ribosome rescue protein Dom34